MSAGGGITGGITGGIGGGLLRSPTTAARVTPARLIDRNTSRERNRMDIVDRNLARFLTASMCYLGVPVSGAGAQAGRSARAWIGLLLGRRRVRAELERSGVSAAQAQHRVDALSDEEVEHLALRLHNLPVRGELLETFFAMLVVLLVTDIFRFTRAFSFTRPAR